MNIYIIIIIIVFNLIVIYLIFKRNKSSYEKIIKPIKELLFFDFALISFIMAIILFDQYGLNKKLTEKRVELVIELLTELKKQEGFGAYPRIKEKDMGKFSFYYEKNMAKKASREKFFVDWIHKPIVMESNDLINGFKKVREVINNPIMPLSIVDKSQFLIASGGIGGSKLNDSPELLYIYFTSEGNKEYIETKAKHWVFSNNNRCTLLEFLQKFDDLFIACEDWINKHSDIDVELNLRGI